METKSGYNSDNLLALIGRCLKCGANNKVYYARCNEEKRDKILEFYRTGRTDWKSTCEVCFRHNLFNTVEWQAVQSFKTTDEELAIINQSSGFSKDQIEGEVMRQEKEAQIGDDFVRENQDRIAFRQR